MMNAEVLENKLPHSKFCVRNSVFVIQDFLTSNGKKVIESTIVQLSATGSNPLAEDGL